MLQKYPLSLIRIHQALVHFQGNDKTGHNMQNSATTNKPTNIIFSSRTPYHENCDIFVLYLNVC